MGMEREETLHSKIYVLSRNNPVLIIISILSLTYSRVLRQSKERRASSRWVLYQSQKSMRWR